MTNEPETGTLAALNVKPGDVVECLDADGCLYAWTRGRSYVVTGEEDAPEVNGVQYGIRHGICTAIFRIVSRASQSDTPKLLKEMTDAEIGALIRAKQRGQIVEIWTGELYGWEEWNGESLHEVHQKVRIRPEPVRETVTGFYWQYDNLHCFSGAPVPDKTHRITFDLIDGKPDCASIRMEEL